MLDQWGMVNTSQMHSNRIIQKLILWLLYLLVFLIPLVTLLVIIAVKFKVKSNADLKETDKPLLPRKRPFDAFIIYHFDSDDQFVVNDLGTCFGGR